MHFRAVGYASTALYALILATFLLPWLDVSSVGIAGFKIAMGEYDIPPTEIYVVLVGVAALCGVIIPHVILRGRMWARMWISLLGLGFMALTLLHRSDEVKAVDPQPELGLYLAIAGFGLVLFLSIGAINGLFTPRPQSQSASRRPVWKE